MKYFPIVAHIFMESVIICNNIYDVVYKHILRKVLNFISYPDVKL